MKLDIAFDQATGRFSQLLPRPALSATVDQALHYYIDLGMSDVNALHHACGSMHADGRDAVQKAFYRRLAKRDAGRAAA